MDNAKRIKRNLWMYPLGTVGRDMIYQLFNSFILTYILITRSLSAAQFLAITIIMIAARIFDAANDPIMGFIIEKTHTKWGKFKPWLAIGMVSTVAVVTAIFNTRLQGWGFVVLFGVVYFLYSITYTMHDISYYGMIPSLSSDANTRNQFTSRAVLFAGIGAALAGMLIPMFTVGETAIASSAQTSYGIIAIAVCAISIFFICFTIFGVQEEQVQTTEKAEHKTIKEVAKTIVRNKPLLWIFVAFLIQQIGNGLVASGIGSTYIYFQYGYEGGKYSLFNTIGLAATAILMVLYPTISKKITRKKLMTIMLITSAVGSVLMLLSGLTLAGASVGFIVLTLGYTLSNFGQYGFYLVMMISIMNTVEYNEYISGDRDEAIITSVRPFVTKMASALILAITNASFVLFKILEHTNKISDLENAATRGELTDTQKIEQIGQVISGIDSTQKLALLLAMVIVPFVLLTISYIIYQKKYTLDEEEYDRICEELKQRKTK